MKQKLTDAQKSIEGLNRRLECTSCGMPMNSKGTWIDGDKFCKDCVREGKYAAELLKQRNKLLKQAADIESQLIDMGYEEYIEPPYEKFTEQKA